MWALVVIGVLPFGELLVEIDVTRLRQQLIELLLVGPMRQSNMTVNRRGQKCSRTSRSDSGLSYSGKRHT